MKRSEMVKILQNSFLNHMNCQDCCNSDEQLYSTVLKEIEEAGMIPPGSKIHKDCMSHYIESYWKPENE